MKQEIKLDKRNYRKHSDKNRSINTLNNNRQTIEEKQVR